MKLPKSALWIAAAAVLAILPALAQAPRTRGARSNTGKATPGAISGQPLATFEGTVHSIGKKMLLIEEEDANTLKLVCSRRTHYFSGSQEIKQSAIQVGNHVSVEARELRDAELEAINVRLQKPKPEPPPQ